MDEGLAIYYGPTSLARQYFHDLGYFMLNRQTTADFLTSITDANEVQFREGFENRAPRTAAEREKAWKSSELYRALKEEMAQYDGEVVETGASDAYKMKRSVRSDKNKGVNMGSNYTVSFLAQVRACARRQLLIKWGQREDQYVKLFTVVSISLMISSLFFSESNDTMGAYSRGGIMLFAGLFNGWLRLSESIEAVTGCIIIQKHKMFGFHRPGR
jgi:ATP-binding cassette, subfamily G (WHITE), member 2, SNQ2